MSKLESHSFDKSEMKKDQDVVGDYSDAHKTAESIRPETAAAVLVKKTDPKFLTMQAFNPANVTRPPTVKNDTNVSEAATKELGREYSMSI